MESGPFRPIIERLREENIMVNTWRPLSILLKCYFSMLRSVPQTQRQCRPINESMMDGVQTANLHIKVINFFLKFNGSLIEILKEP